MVQCGAAVVPQCFAAWSLILTLSLLFSHTTNAANNVDPVERNISHDGLVRYFVELRPASFTVGKSPVLIVLHGASGNMKDILSFPLSVQASSERYGYLVLSPNAADMYTNATKGGSASIWNCGWNFVQPLPPDSFDQIDDAGFLAALAQWAVAERGANARRIYLLGVSNGGGMVQRALMSQMQSTSFAPVFAAAASLVAPMAIRATEVANTTSKMTTTPLFLLMGTKDKAIPFEGGTIGTNIGLNLGTGLSARATKEFWIAANRADASQVQRTKLRNRIWLDGCTVDSEFYPALTTTAAAANVTAASSPLVFFTVRGGGHVVPNTNVPRRCWLRGLGPCRGIEAMWGPLCAEVDTLDLVWSFLSQYSR